MNTIGVATRVHLIATSTTGNRCYLASVTTQRNKFGELILDARWDDDPSMSKPMTYEQAVIFKRRMQAEHNVAVKFAHAAGDAAELID